MADLLGPSGQPLQPTPFQTHQQQQSMSSDVSINTQSAQQAFAGLQKVLDDISKTFGIDSTKAIQDRLKAEESYFKAVGDKIQAQTASLKRQSNEYISSIEKEKNVKIAAFEEETRAGKHTQDELDAYRKQLSDKAQSEKISTEKRTSDKISKLPKSSRASELVEKATAFAGGLGGPVGSTVAAVGNFLTNPLTAIVGGLLFAAEQTALANAAFTKTGAQLAGAGFGLRAGAREGTDFTSNLFGGSLNSILSPALSQEQQRQIIGTIATSRTFTGQTQTAEGADSFQKNLGLYANILPDAAEETKLFTDATKTLGMSQKDLTNIFVSSRVSAEKLKITQLDAINTQLEMQKALRNITNDGAVASGILSNISGYLDSIGASETEKQRIGISVAQAGANLTLPQIAGMFAFTHGGQMPTPETLFGANGTGKGGMLGNEGRGVFGLMGQFLTKVGNQFTDPTQRMFAADQLRQQFMPGLRLQDLPKFFDISNAMMKPNANMASLTTQFEKLEKSTPAQAAADGIMKLVEVVGPIQMLENVFSNFWRDLDALILKYIPHQTQSRAVAPGDPDYVNPWKPANRNVHKRIQGGHHSPSGGSGAW